MIEYLTLSQLAEKLGVTTRAVLKWVSDGRCPKPFYVGRLPRWLESDIDAFFTAQTMPYSA